MKAYIVTFYTAGQRRAADCYPDFIPTRDEAIAIGQRTMSEAQASREADGANVWNWPVRFTVRQTII